MLPQTVNAYYSPGTNEICFPAGDPAEAVLHARTPTPAENYGGIGAVIGHEIGHGFDDQGAQYDGAGNLHDWWTPDDKARLRGEVEGADRAVRRASSRATLPGEHVNGALTVGENIGDLGGLTIAPQGVPDLARRGAGADGSRTSPAQRLFLNWALLLADQAPQGARPAVPHDRPAQPAGVPRQHRAQPRRVPRGVRHPAGRRALARARRTRVRIW